MVDYNGNSDSDLNNNMEFIDVNQPCNKLIVWLLPNDFIIFIKKDVYSEQNMKIINP